MHTWKQSLVGLVRCHQCQDGVPCVCFSSETFIPFQSPSIPHIPSHPCTPTVHVCMSLQPLAQHSAGCRSDPPVLSPRR